MPTQHIPTVSPPSGEGRRGLAAMTCAVLWRHRRFLARATIRVVALYALAGTLMTAAVFALAWPCFTRMRDQRVWYQQNEEPYLHDHTDLALVALAALPLFLLLLGIGSAAVQTVCSRVVAAVSSDSSQDEPPPGVAFARLRPVLAVYALRGLIVWPLPLLTEEFAHSLTGYQLDTDEQVLERGSWLFTCVTASPAVAVFVAVLLRLALSLAPACAAADVAPVAALRRSWSLTWTRFGAVRVVALALPLAALTAGVVRLVVQVALPLRPLVRGLLEAATGNSFAAYYAGILAPVIVGILATAAVILPIACTAFAILHQRLWSSRTASRGVAATA
ncbi:hypothetical protein [Streptomyces sp. NPDC046860]|uniref:hypothetical protein n=1 Tax=Streptomyces sp. NPDC046860 TaxID=3154495 RepID=UPI0033DEE0A9